MAGSLIKIAETTVSSAVSSVTLTGIDSTYDVYMVKSNNVTVGTDNVYVKFRFTESGTPNTTANYDVAYKELRAYAVFGNVSATNETSAYFSSKAIGTGTQEQSNSIHYIFNANNSSEYTFYTMEVTLRDQSAGNHNGGQGGGVFTSASTVDCLQIFAASGNIETGVFSLYGYKK